MSIQIQSNIEEKYFLSEYSFEDTTQIPTQKDINASGLLKYLHNLHIHIHQNESGIDPLPLLKLKHFHHLHKKINQKHEYYRCLAKTFVNYNTEVNEKIKERKKNLKWGKWKWRAQFLCWREGYSKVSKKLIKKAKNKALTYALLNIQEINEIFTFTFKYNLFEVNDEEKDKYKTLKEYMKTLNRCAKKTCKIADKVFEDSRDDTIKKYINVKNFIYGYNKKLQTSCSVDSKATGKQIDQRWIEKLIRTAKNQPNEISLTDENKINKINKKDNTPEDLKNVFKKLEEKVKNVHQISVVVPEGHSHTASIFKGQNKENKALIFIKTPNPWHRYSESKQDCMPTRELAFIIDWKLGLGVIPTTIFHPKMAIQSKKENERKQYCPACIIQKAIPLGEQVHLEKNQLNIEQCDMPQIKRALLANIILGRGDADRPVNSVLDKQHRIFEIDNEFIGNAKTDTWLFKSFTTLKFDKNDKKIINKIKNKWTEKTIDECFEIFKERHPLEKDENMETQMQIKSNLLQLKKIFSENQEVTVDILKNCFYYEDNKCQGQVGQ